MLAWLTVSFTLIVVVRSERSVNHQHPFPVHPPFPAESRSHGETDKHTHRGVGCDSLPNGWMLSMGHCRRFFTVCVNGFHKRMDCYEVAKAAYPHVSNDRTQWVFNEAIKRCTRRSNCERFGLNAPAPKMRAAPPLTLPVTKAASAFHLPAKCIPGVSYPVAACSRTFMRCSHSGALLPFLCPPHFLFDPTVMACLSKVRGCHDPSKPNLPMLDGIERAWDRENRAGTQGISVKKEKQYANAPESASRRIVSIPDGRQSDKKASSQHSHSGNRARDELAIFDVFQPSHFVGQPHPQGIFDAFNNPYF